MDDDVQAAIAGGLRLLEPSARRAPEQVEALLHPDFFEFGASGRRWDRREMVAALAQEPDAEPAVASELTGIRLADGIVLVTYVSQRGQRRCLRSSIWRKTTAGWQVYFHQGTMIAPG
jgi:hypothetical protein